MTNEAKDEDSATVALPSDGSTTQPASAKATAYEGRGAYSAPKLRSLGKVAELTFAKSVRGSESGSPQRRA
jgi:hypothetical protein